MNYMTPLLQKGLLVLHICCPGYWWWDLHFHQWHTSPSECSHCSQHGSTHVYTCIINHGLISCQINLKLYKTTKPSYYKQSHPLFLSALNSCSSHLQLKHTSGNWFFSLKLDRKVCNMKSRSYYYLGILCISPSPKWLYAMVTCICLSRM